ncbi:hypothetical protein FRB97_001932 [Tulasnella sp. 331]|nr:hypothetical protein FRB97_001932 [Tulasnella sp. 331]
MASKELTGSAGTCILSAAQMSIQILQSLSNFIPIPYVAIAVTLACQVIQIGQAVQANVEAIKLLNDRVYSVILVILTNLKGKKEQDIPTDLREGIGRLTKDLLAIEKDVKRVKARTDTKKLTNKAKAIIGYGDNAGMIANCTSRLDWAMWLFEVEGRIQDSLRMVEVLGAVREVHEGMRDMRRDVGTILSGFQNLDVMPKNSLPSAAIPPKPELFYGRLAEVEEIVRRIISTQSARFGLLGPGGIGKTSVASAVLHHPNIVEHFNSRIHWSRCDEVTSPPLLMEVIARSFHLDQVSTDRLQDIVSFLQSDTRPCMLLLDNFETPWDIEGRQSEITDILCALTAFPHLAILVTMRGTLPGVGRVKWSQPELLQMAVLPIPAAYDLYVEIDRKAAHDENLKKLLAELDHMPLAVTLMAKVGSEGESPTELLKRWNSHGTDVLHDPGGDRRTSVNLSIQLSLHTNQMKNNPDALRLLSVLAILPGGMRVDTIQDLVPNIPDPAKARNILLRASLVHSRAGTNSIHLLSPIRSYIRRHHPITPQLWQGLHQFCFTYVTQHSLRRSGDAGFDEDLEALAVEEINLVTILSHALQNHPSEATITISLTFMVYQSRTFARSGPHIAIAAAAAAREVGTRSQEAACLQRLGEINTMHGRYQDARDALNKAYPMFQELNDTKRSVGCILVLGDIARLEARYEDARNAFEVAREGCLRLTGYSRLSDCLRGLGDLARLQGRYHDAQMAYEDGRRECKLLRDLAGSADCLRGLGSVARMQGRYTDAESAYKKALKELKEQRSRRGSAYCLLWLGNTYLLQGLLGNARAELDQAYKEFEEIGDRNGAGECLKWLGNIDWNEGKIEEGRSKLQKALRQFSLLGQPDDVAECLQGLGEANVKEGRYGEGREALEEALGTLERLNMPKGVAGCLTSLGELLIKEARFFEARAVLDKAHAIYGELGVQDWWQSRCITLLAYIPSLDQII